MTHTRPFSLPVSPDVFKQKSMKARHNVCKVLKRGLQEYLCSFKASRAGRMRGRVWLLRATSLSLEQPGSFLSLLWNAVTQRRRSFPEGVWIHVLAALWVWALRATNTSWKEHIWTGTHHEPDSRERMEPASHSSQRLLSGPFPNVHSNCCEDLHKPLGIVSSQSQESLVSFTQ